MTDLAPSGSVADWAAAMAHLKPLGAPTRIVVSLPASEAIKETINEAALVVFGYGWLWEIVFDDGPMNAFRHGYIDFHATSVGAFRIPMVEVGLESASCPHCARKNPIILENSNGYRCWWCDNRWGAK